MIYQRLPTLFNLRLTQQTGVHNLLFIHKKMKAKKKTKKNHKSTIALKIRRIKKNQ